MPRDTEGPPISAEEMAAFTPEQRALIERLMRQCLDQAAARIAKIEADVARVEAENARLREEIARLQAAAGGFKKTPQNSSLPPSTVHPHAKPGLLAEAASTAGAPPQGAPDGNRESDGNDGANGQTNGEAGGTRTKRKRGGQPGHPKHERKLVPEMQCQRVIPLKPDTCQGCGAALNGDDPDPIRHQVWEIPEPQPEITEYQRHRLTCSCGCTTCGELPVGVPDHCSGPRLVAIAALLLALFRQSKSKTAVALQMLFGIPACAGFVVKLQNQAQQSLDPSYSELKGAAAQMPVANCDETAMREGQLKTWLWVAAGPVFTVFLIAASRSAAVIKTLLGVAYRGIVCCDRYAGYNDFNNCRQLCWAHLKRDMQAIIDGGNPTIGIQLMTHLDKVFDHWRAFCRGELTRRQLWRRLQRDVLPELKETLETGLRSRCALTRNLCDDMLSRWDQLWRFAQREGVQPTNNRAEQALRHAVIWRKLSFGTQSAAGSRFVETMLTVIETCRQQKIDVLTFITESIAARNHSRPGPSLLPASNQTAKPAKHAA